MSMASITKYALRAQNFGFTINLFDEHENNIARITFRVDGTIDAAFKDPPSGTWPTTAFVRAGAPFVEYAGILDLLRNEQPARFTTDLTKTPVTWDISTSLEPAGEGEA